MSEKITMLQAKKNLQEERDAYRSTNWKQTLDIALDAIEKLQKIEKVIDYWNHDVPEYKCDEIDGDTYVCEIENILLGCDTGNWLKREMAKVNMQTLKQEIKEKFKKMDDQQFDNFMKELRIMYNKTHNKNHYKIVRQVYYDEIYSWENKF